MTTRESSFPGFSAEAVFGKTGNYYGLEARSVHTSEQVVIPQLPKWLRCAAAVVGAAATCELTAAAGPAGWAACAAATTAATAVCE
jgi:hypothetical protein